MIKEIENPGVIALTDWDRVRSCFETIRTHINNGTYRRSINDQRLESSVYPLGDGGVAVKGTKPIAGKDEDSWHGWSGPWLEKILWWAAPIRKRFELEKLPINTITFHNHRYDIETHIDFNSEVVSKNHELQVNINFMVDSVNPENDYTYAIDPQGHIKRYPHHSGKLWMINAGIPHGVKCSGPRSALIIKLHSPYEKIEEFLNSNPDIFDENQPYFKNQ